LRGTKQNKAKTILDPAAWILLLSFCVSLAALIAYLLDFDYSDTTLFFLLTVIRYSSFMLCICAFYKLSVNIYRCIRDREFRPLRLLLYIVIIFYGIIVILMDAFIITISRGNG
jgi:hypothetical protein